MVPGLIVCVLVVSVLVVTVLLVVLLVVVGGEFGSISENFCRQRDVT